jgi:hypothetical protein
VSGISNDNEMKTIPLVSRTRITFFLQEEVEELQSVTSLRIARARAAELEPTIGIVDCGRAAPVFKLEVAPSLAR